MTQLHIVFYLCSQIITPIPMKQKIQLFAAAAMVALLSLSGCRPGTTEGGGSGDKVSLEVKVGKGDVYKTVTKTQQTSEQSVMGMTTKASTLNEIYLKNEVTDVNAEGEARIKATYERVRTELDNGMTGKTSFDSDKADGEVPMEAKSYMAMIGRSIYYTLDKRGTVVKVEGVDSLFDAVMAAMGLGEAGEEMAAMMAPLKASFGDEGIKSMMQSTSIMYPDVLIAEGDTWGKQINSMGAMPLKMEVTYKVDHIDADKVVLSFEGTITSDKTKALDLGIASMQMDLSGDYSGTSEIDRKTGMVLTSEVKQKMSGSMSTMGMNMPMKINQTVTVGRY